MVAVKRGGEVRPPNHDPDTQDVDVTSRAQSCFAVNGAMTRRRRRETRLGSCDRKTCGYISPPYGGGTVALRLCLYDGSSRIRDRSEHHFDYNAYRGCGGGATGHVILYVNVFLRL